LFDDESATACDKVILHSINTRRQHREKALPRVMESNNK
jgi:hypothetical protein